jgi:hypothetical protein
VSEEQFVSETEVQGDAGIPVLPLRDVVVYPTW